MFNLEDNIISKLPNRPARPARKMYDQKSG